MSTHRTAEQAKHDHIEVMGDALGTIYDALWQQIAWAHGKWSDFVVLFGTSESRVALLNRAAPQFFRLAQDSVWENILLHIARLTDPPCTAKKKNLTIQRLSMLIDRPDCRNKVEIKVGEALATCEFARDWRNRRIAHADLDLAISKDARPLEFASRQCVKHALASLAQVLDAIAAEYLNSTTSFDTLDGDAMALLYVIDDGLKSEAKRRERLRNGLFDPVEPYPREI